MNSNTLPIPTPGPALPASFTFGNCMIVFIAAAVLFYGLHRIAHFTFSKQFFLLNVPVAIMCVAGFLFVATHRHYSDSYARIGFAATRFALSFMPLMILLVFVMGIGAVIIGIHAKEIRELMLEHPLKGTLLAMFLSPTSNALIPIVEDVWKQPNMQPYMLLYLQGSALASLPLFMLRQTGFTPGTGIPVKMYFTGFIVSILMIVFMRPIFWLADALCGSFGSAYSTIVDAVQALL